jgi:hypothetical protein
MYLLYEHHFNADGSVAATDMMLSSSYPGKPWVNWRSASDKAIFEYSKIVFKNIHIQNRNYDPATNVWTFFSDNGKKVYEDLKASPIVGVGLKIERVENLADQAAAKYIAKPTISSWNSADFFYNPQGVVQSTGPTKDQIVVKLATLLGIPENDLESLTLLDLKKPYRRAALALHPDRNGGDASQMTELNYLWQQWGPYAKT